MLMQTLVNSFQVVQIDRAFCGIFRWPNIFSCFSFSAHCVKHVLKAEPRIYTEYTHHEYNILHLHLHATAIGLEWIVFRRLLGVSDLLQRSNIQHVGPNLISEQNPANASRESAVDEIYGNAIFHSPVSALQLLKYCDVNLTSLAIVHIQTKSDI